MLFLFLKNHRKRNQFLLEFFLLELSCTIIKDTLLYLKLHTIKHTFFYTLIYNSFQELDLVFLFLKKKITGIDILKL